MNNKMIAGAVVVGIAAGFVGVMSSASGSKTVGVSMSAFDDNFLTVLRNGMTEYAEGLDGVELQVEDADDDVGKQLNQIENFIAAGVDAIIVNAADTSATQGITDMVTQAGIPLVYVNRLPGEKTLPDKVVFVGSDEKVSGTPQGSPHFMRQQKLR